MIKNKFQVESGSVLFDGRCIGWAHISRATGEIKATASFPNNKIVVYAYSSTECERLLDRAYAGSKADDI